MKADSEVTCVNEHMVLQLLNKVDDRSPCCGYARTAEQCVTSESETESHTGLLDVHKNMDQTCLSPCFNEYPPIHVGCQICACLHVLPPFSRYSRSCRRKRGARNMTARLACSDHAFV